MLQGRHGPNPSCLEKLKQDKERKEGESILHEVVRRGRAALVKTVVDAMCAAHAAEEPSIGKSGRSQGKKRPLAAAAAPQSSIAVLSRDSEHDTPLHLAVRTGKVGMVQALLEAGHASTSKNKVSRAAGPSTACYLHSHEEV